MQLKTAQSGTIPVEHCSEMLDELSEMPAAARRSYFGRRLREALENVERKGSADGLDDDLKYLSELDEARQHDSYALGQDRDLGDPHAGIPRDGGGYYPGIG